VSRERAWPAVGVAGVEDGHPPLGGVGRVREQPVERRVVEPNGLGFVLARRVPGQLLERGPANRDVQPEHAGAVQVRSGVPPVVVLGDDGGEGHPAAGGVVLRVVEEERVAPGGFGCAVRLAGRDGSDARQAGDERDDLLGGHTVKFLNSHDLIADASK
jgi:hypothetical protein